MNNVKELKLEVDKQVAKGQYTNMAIIAHTKDEFILDFVLNYPGHQPFVTSRMITSPQHAQAFMKSLEDNIKRYEARFGTLPEVSPNAKAATEKN